MNANATDSTYGDSTRVPKIAKILVQTKMTGLRTLHGVVRVTVLNQLRKVLIKIDQRKTRMLCSKFLLP